MGCKYKIASFNMNNFGVNSVKDFEKIAQIIEGEEFDIVAMQEILSNGKGVKRLIERELRGWDFQFDLPTESDDSEKLKDMIIKDKRGEGYVYLWNKKKFKLLEFSKLGKKRTFEPRIINSLSNDVNLDCSFFARTPYYIRLQPKNGGFFELRLINIHIYFGDNTLPSICKRKKEFDVLTKDIYPEISEKRYGQFRVAYTIAMGDYNLNIFSPDVQTPEKYCLTHVHTYDKYNKTVKVRTVQDKLTTLRNMDNYSETENIYGNRNMYANNYDHFTYSQELSEFKSVSFDVVDAVQKYCDGDFSYYRKNISDHLPIAITVEI